MTLKALNLYAGIGGNRKLWDGVVDDLEVTAVEIDEKIAEIYQDFFPNDKVVVKDAHEFLKENYEGYNFIWSSPPCPTHSQVRYRLGYLNGMNDAVYPDMRLYQEIIFLKYYFEGDYVVENPESYYEPLIRPQKRQRHYFWSNFYIPPVKLEKNGIKKGTNEDRMERLGIDLSGYNIGNKRKLLRNCVHPKLGKHILKSAYKNKVEKLEAFC